MAEAAAAGRLARPWGRRSLALAVPLVLAALLAVHDAAQLAVWFGTPSGASVDVGVYHSAAERLAAGGRLYADPPPCCFSYAAMDGRYTYPPLLAILLRPLAGMDVDTLARLWLALSLACIAAFALLAARMLRGHVGAVAALWLGVALLAYGPLQAALYGGQVDPELLLVAAVGAWAVVRGGPGWLAGAATALGASIKVSPILNAPALLRLSAAQRRRALVALVAGLAIAAAVMLAASSETTTYVLRILPSFSGGVIAPWNRSLPGVVLRVAGATGTVPGRALAVTFSVLAAAGLAATWWLCRPGHDARRGRALTLAGLLAVVPTLQGVTWDHHLVVYLLVVVLVAPSLLRWTPGWWLVAGGLALTSVNQQAIDARLTDAGLLPAHGAAQTALLAVEGSINLAGMVCLWACAVLCARRERERGPAPATWRTRPTASPAAP